MAKAGAATWTAPSAPATCPRQVMMATLWPAMNILESGKFVQKLKYGCELQGTPVGECRMPWGR
jgi:hypothetical protein